MGEPLYRKTFEAGKLLEDHPPQFRHPYKSALFAVAYPDGKATPASMEVTRWHQEVPEPLTLAAEFPVEVRAGFYDYETLPGPGNRVEWHVNFADPRLFAAYGSGLFAQDEMQVVEHPLLGSVREALLAQGLSAKTNDDTVATPILLRNIERRIEVATNANAEAGRPAGLYGNRFAEASIEAIRRATRRIEPPTFSNIIAIAAPSGGRGDYTERQIQYIFGNAFTAFLAASRESVGVAGTEIETVVHSGFWGCGAFGGNRKLMIALQALAARAANISRLIFHVGDPAGLEDAQRGVDVAQSLASRCGVSCSLDTLVGRAVILGYRWGVSDGN